MSKRQLKKYTAEIRALYKRKDQKIRPVNIPLPDGINPRGGVNPSANLRDPYMQSIPRGSRLTPERLATMKIGPGFLSPAEKQLFVDILFKYESAIAFDDSEMGLLRPEIEPPAVIHTVPHIPWQQQNIRLPHSVKQAATKIVKARLDNGLLEFSQGPYRNRYFLVDKKKAGERRLILDVQLLNKVTIRDSGMPPSVDEFSEDFAGYPITSAIDYYSGYNQISLDKQSRDLTAFLTDIGLLRSTRLVQGWTNSVAYFQRVMGKVHFQQIPHEVRPFLDDCAIKGPKDRYDDAEISPGVRRFVYEHVEIFERFMHDAWSAGLTISGEKVAIGVPGITIVGMVCDYDGRHPEQKKVQKIVDWPLPQCTKDARAFIGLVVYYRIFIVGFAIVAAPIFVLFRKNVKFNWTEECQLAMDELKRRITTAPVLISLDFSPSALTIILNVDASTKIGWGGTLSQLQADGTIRPARFESGIWNAAEKKYDAVKLECRGLLKALKKFRFWLFGRHFLVETDAQTLVWLLNQPPNDLPNAMMTRWLAYIRLFDFDVKHIPGNKNSAADALSRRGLTAEDPDESEDESDDYFDGQLYSMYVTENNSPIARIYLHEGEYEGDDLILGRYLENLQRPANLTDQQYQRLRKKSRDFLVRDGYLFKRGRKRNIPPRRVIGQLAHRQGILIELHDEAGHRGAKVTYDHISRRYQWKGMYEDVLNYIKTCEECQRRARTRYEEPLHPTWSITVWEKVGIDVVHMPNAGNYKYIVLARDDLSGWVEGRALTAANSRNVSRFIYEEVICRHGCPTRIVMDRGTENLNLTKELLERYRIQQTLVSAYHPQANGLVERGHDALVNSLAKYSKRAYEWRQYLPLALWADRVSVRRSTGYSAFELVYGRDCLLPVQISIESWCMVDWEKVESREDLLTARMKQLDERNLAEALAAENLRNSRKSNKVHFDKHKRFRGERTQLQVGDLVLIHNTKSRFSRSRKKKLDDNWRGPYRVRKIPEDSTYYMLEELDGTRLAVSIAGNRLKKFFSRTSLEEARGHDWIRNDELEAEEVEYDDDVEEEEESEQDENEEEEDGKDNGS